MKKNILFESLISLFLGQAQAPANIDSSSTNVNGITATNNAPIIKSIT